MPLLRSSLLKDVVVEVVVVEVAIVFAGGLLNSLYFIHQVLMERFNNDTKIFCFILSTRSGGVGVNLTGADTVIFYDSDWNPTMDAQAQDRCHRIGQTRDVHIYRLISEQTIEENILKKAHQKKLLGDIAIEGGNFTTSVLKEVGNVTSVCIFIGC